MELRTLLTCESPVLTGPFHDRLAQIGDRRRVEHAVSSGGAGFQDLLDGQHQPDGPQPPLPRRVVSQEIQETSGHMRCVGRGNQRHRRVHSQQI